jgi:hypothetical protein
MDFQTRQSITFTSSAKGQKRGNPQLPKDVRDADLSRFSECYVLELVGEIE